MMDSTRTGRPYGQVDVGDYEAGEDLDASSPLGKGLDDAATMTTGPHDPDETDETVALRNDIEQTRGELGETINAIQDKLSPQALVEQAKETVRETASGVAEQARATVREATIGKAEQMVSDVGETARGTGSSLIETIRQNPLPAALAAIGLGWLWMNRAPGKSTDGSYTSYGSSYRPSGSYDDPSYTTRPSYATRSPYGASAPSYADANAYSYQGMRADGVDQSDSGGLGEVINQAREGAGQLVDRAQSSVGAVVEGAQSGAGALATGAQQRAQGAQGQLQQMMQETPLAVGGIALALGAAVGLAIPSTQPEQQLMGEARDTLVQRAQDTAQETMQKVQQVAQKAGAAAADTARDEAQHAGLAGR